MGNPPKTRGIEVIASNCGKSFFISSFGHTSFSAWQPAIHQPTVSLEVRTAMAGVPFSSTGRIIEDRIVGVTNWWRVYWLYSFSINLLLFFRRLWKRLFFFFCGHSKTSWSLWKIIILIHSRFYVMKIWSFGLKP